jgi:hypothetical protein
MRYKPANSTYKTKYIFKKIFCNEAGGSVTGGEETRTSIEFSRDRKY